MKQLSRYWLAIVLLGLAPWAYSRPEIIRADVSYYSDGYVQQEGVRDIGSEKNYEEVYQFYTYYEAVYDSEKRVKIFREYKKGNVIHEEHYQYTNGSVERTVIPR
ncbi:MAG: hypothetical protein OEY89_05625 [Gammaproteobacteria bacterium]|nr:hypothetical protein [Gammaproteobacteria bacterium]